MSLLSVINQLTGNMGGGSGSTPPPSNNALVFFFTGESNSVGYAANSEAPSGELGVRSNVKILNNTSLAFENLNIGSNNANEIANTHGWELEIANQINSGGIAGFTDCYIVKTGKGGTKIADWNVGGTWEVQMAARMTAALNLLTAAGKTPKIICFYSQGINDVALNTAPVWKADTLSHFAHLRSLYGSTLPIIMTKFLSPFAVFNTAMDEIDTAESNTVAIDATGTTFNVDNTHWNYSGQKEMCNRMIAAAETFL
jgi:hypothetical protein